MKHFFDIRKEFDVKTLIASMNVRYWEDASVDGKECSGPSDMPLSDGDCWNIAIDIEEGKIIDWPHGRTADVNFKVCDGGEYSLLDENGKTIVSYHGYVPKMLCPEENGYGDYVIMKIDEAGQINKWRSYVSDFVDRADNQTRR